MNAFDGHLLAFCNQFAQRSWVLDRLVAFFADTDVVQGGVILSAVWWAWFRPPGKRGQARRILIGTFTGTAVAVLVVRALSLLLPFRPRPASSPALDWVMPFGMPDPSLELLSAFPSASAALFVGIATGLLLVSKRLGILTIAYAVLVIGSSQVYVGLHYPTDVLGGALIGALFVRLATRPAVRRALAGYPIHVLDTQPGAFYVALFLVTFETSRSYADLTAVGTLIATLVRSL